MSWTATNAYSPTVTKKPSMATTTASNSTSTGATSEGSVFSERAIDQARDDVVVPLVLWNEPPRMDITCLHVLYLPMSQPSQNTSALMNRWPSLASFVQQYSSNNLNANATGSSFTSLNSSHSMLNLKRVLSQHRSKRNSLSVEDRVALATAISNLANGAGADLMDDDEFQYVDDGDFDTDDELYQLCVFAGTADGAIVFWLFEQDIVVQVNVLVHPSVSEGYRDELLTGNSTRQISPVQSVVSGIDEWGQSNLISVTRDGAVARWELPNGVCARADVTLAAQLAPVKGMEMFCNNRYAIVYGEQSRMMVLDTWKMTMIYCVDTAQEQVRRSIAVVELKMTSSRSTASFAGKSNARSLMENTVRRASDGDQDGSTMVMSPSFVGSSSGAGVLSPSSFLSNGGPSSSSNLRPLAGSGAQLNQIWDSLVISLGSEGLAKCFLWSKPRGGNSNVNGGYQWVQQSCWVISWADEADDITCSQSTSLKDGDNMNPQTALMRSIKSSYFPHALYISADASLLLFIWESKWVVLKRKWLCDISPPGSATQNSQKPANKSRPSQFVGSCRIHPSVFLGQQSKGHVKWQDGAFLGDNQVALWTNTGHVFQFSVSGSAVSPSGKLFVFTKDQDQLVPRSYHKTLNTIQKGEFIAFLDQCDCCSSDQLPASSFRTDRLRNRLDLLHKTTKQGFTSCVISSGAPTSLLSPSSSSTRMVHMCPNGSIGCWNLSSSKTASSPRVNRSVLATQPIQDYERVKFHTFSDGFVGGESSNGKSATRKPCLTHLILGREESRSSSCYANPLQTKRRRRRHENVFLGGDRVASTPSAATMASTVIANAFAPVSSLIPSVSSSTRAATFSGTLISEEINSQYLMDVPVIARSYHDGSVEFVLLGGKSHASNNPSTDRVRVQCHGCGISSLAHCIWITPDVVKETTSSSPPTIRRSVTSASTNNNGVYMSSRRAKTIKHGTPMEDSYLATDKNPFHRARFPPTVQKRTSGSRYLNIHASTVSPHPPPTPLKPSLVTSVTDPAANFVVFTGGVDGSLKVLELSLQFEGESFVVEANVLQSFKQHRGAIKEIVISPMMRENSPYPERYVATIGEDNTVNVYAPIYLQNPFAHGPARTPSRSRCNIEWECVMAFCEHPDTICGIEWVTDRGVLMVECEDRKVYVWNLDTGLLDRSIPTSLVYEGGNLSIDGRQEGESESDIASVECTNLGIGDSSLHLLKFNVNKSAELIKANWKTYYFGLVRGKSRFAADQEGGSSATSKRATSPYAVGSIELVLLSFLLSWGAAPEIDRACRDLLGLETPHSLYSCVLMDQTSGAITIPVPWKSIFSPMSPNSAEANPFPRKWQHSSALSANVALGIVSLCMNLMEHKYSKSEPSESSNGAPLVTPSSPRNKEEFHVLWSQLITQHSVVLPDYVPFFREPSLEFLAKYGFHTSDYTQLAARALLSGIIKRLAPLSRSALCAEYSTKLHCEIIRLETETGAKLNTSSTSLPIDPVLVVSRLGSLVILLSMVGTCFPGEISPAGAREVCDILVYLLRAPAQYIASVAAELLTKGLMLFRPHLVDLSSLICQLLIIDMREKQRNPGDDSPTFGSNARVLASGGSNAALSLLVELGACETAFVLNLLQQEMNNADRPHAFRECILLYLTELINTHYLLMFRHLSAVVDTIMCCLDPTKPERRKRCLELSTICLHNIVRRFPMVDFHKDTQRLALGTMEAVILIYDLRTATKWRVLDGHTSAVSALSFRTDGQILVSYAAREGSVRFWNSGNAGIFGGMLKMQQSCIKEHKLEVLRGFAHAPASSGGASADLKQVIQTCRFQFLVLKDAPNGNQQALAPGSSEAKERRVLRLTREDASQVQFLM